jgi:hypothetical protein
MKDSAICEIVVHDQNVEVAQLFRLRSIGAQGRILLDS